MISWHRIAATAIPVVAALALAPSTFAASALDHEAPPSSLDNDEWVSAVPSAYEERATIILTQRFGNAFTNAPTRWVKCPTLVAYRDARNEGNYYQPCEAEYGNLEKRWAIYLMFLTDGDGRMTYSVDHRGPFRVSPIRCSVKPYQSVAYRYRYRIATLEAGQGSPGCGLAAKMLDNTSYRRGKGARRFTTWTGGTGTGGYPDRYRYACERSGKVTQTIRCENRLGHRFQATLKPR